MRAHVLSITAVLLLSGLVPTLAQDGSVPQSRLAASVSKPFIVKLTSEGNTTYVRAPAPPVLALHLKDARPLGATLVPPAPPAAPPKPTRPALLPVVNQEDIKPKHQAITHEVLMLLPEKCRDTLQNFYVRYDNPEHRGLAGKTTLILNGNVPDDEFRALLIHELGHVFDLNPDISCLGGTPSTGETAFTDGSDLVYADDPSLEFYQISWVSSKAQRANTRPEDFVSGYAQWDVFEDFAESFAYYVLHRDTFHARAQTNAALAAKYRWFQTHLFTEEEELQVALGLHEWNGSPPWDITKLPYVWQPENVFANNR